MSFLHVLKSRLPKRVLFFLLSVKNTFKPDWILRLDKKFEAVIPASRSSEDKIRVLIGPSFSIWQPSAVVDKVLSAALELRGCEILPIYCDGIQENECNCAGGAWTSTTSFSTACKSCINSSEWLWNSHGEKLIKLSLHQDPNFSRLRYTENLNKKNVFELLSFVEDGVPLGKLAKNILVNNHLVGNVELVPNFFNLLVSHIVNLRVLYLCYQNVLEVYKPDRVVSNDSFYGMWNVLELVCKQNSIPFYSHWPALKDRVAFAKDDAAMNLNFSESWNNFSKLPLTDEDKLKIEAWLQGKRGLELDSTKALSATAGEENWRNIDPELPTVLMAPNVIWDLAALDKQVIFEDMIEWIEKTIVWFSKHPNYQLVIKPHPVEQADRIPNTKQSVEYSLRARGIVLPPNVFLLKANTAFTITTLRKKLNLKAVSVHTTTVGYEFPANGLPAITTGKAPYRGFGFTIDPSTETEYFIALEKTLSSKEKNITDVQIELSRKFLKFYQFHYYSNLDIYTDNPPNIKEDICDTIATDNGSIDFIARKIISGKQINGEVEWLPQS